MHDTTGVGRAIALLTATLLITACGAEGDGATDDPDATASATVADTPDATIERTTAASTIAIGEVRTVEVRGRVLASLPGAPPAVDAAEVALGRLLFWDPVLSGDRDVACATCHLPELGYTDGRARSVGVGGVGRGPERQVGHTGETDRNAQSVLDVAWNGIGELGLFDPATAPMFHDSRASGIPAQALDPIRSLTEMRGDGHTAETIGPELASRLASVADYALAFESVYGAGDITLERVAGALAAFQSTLVANDAPFDRWVRGEADAMSAAELDGMDEFVAAGCADCHSGPAFSDFETHVLGVEEASGLAEPDVGDGDFAFRTPSLRQLRFTGPYFHGGQHETLADVLDFYDRPRRSRNPNVADAALDPELLDVPNLDRGERAAILRFLDTLNDEGFDRSVPETVPSGLPVGGSLGS